MNIYPKLAVATAGAAVLASVVTAPAAAADFVLNGRLGSYTSFGFPPTPIDNGSFDGTYSYLGQTLRYPDRITLPINSFNINLRSADGRILETFNTNNSDGIIISGSPLDLSGAFDQVTLSFSSNRDNGALHLAFPGYFAGVGDEEGEALSGRTYASVGEYRVPGASGTSKAVPEPQKIAGAIVAGCFFFQIHRKIASSQKAKS